MATRPRNARTRKAAIVDSPGSTDVESNSDNDRNESKQQLEQSRRAAKGKRRVSIIVPEDSSSNKNLAESNSLLRRRSSGALQELNLNDDSAEKRRRRKSIHTSFGPGAPLEDDETANNEGTSSRGKRPSTPERQSEVASAKTPKMTALARANQLKAVEATPAPPVSIDSSNFEEWMKLATDNKINATNSWNFALIDYFHDMSLLRNDSDNSINFQKASFTLDGCVKIWTSRVDSVGTETGKLLSNLANEGKGEQDGDGEGGAGAGDDGEGDKAKKRKAHRTESTLAKTFAQLQVKKLDLEFTVDPLFKKTCADFDEGGAMGLLMNHLAVDVNMRVVLDAGDSKLDKEAEEEEVLGVIDLGELREKFIPNLSSIAEKTISQTLSDFRFSADPFNLDLNALQQATAHESFNGFEGDDTIGDDGEPAAFGDGAADGAGDFFSGDQAVGDEFGGPMDDNVEGPSDDADHNNVPGLGAAPHAFEPFDPRKAPNERDLVLAMTEEGEEMLDYFDATFMKNWAGPEHWKLKRVVRKPEQADNSGTTKQKKEKATFQIQFQEPPTAAETSKQLFTPSGKVPIVLPSKSGAAPPSKRRGSKKAATAKREDHLLPDDMHFSSQQLLRLFLKPKFMLRMRRSGAAGGETWNENGDGEIDERFWARAAADKTAHLIDDDNEDTQGENPIPFNTQFFQDDDDDGPGFDDFGEGDAGPGHQTMADDQDLMAASEAPLKRARPEFVQYAKRAKRVDVRKLKESIWKGLDIVVDEKADDSNAGGSLGATDPNESRVFDTVIQDLRNSYSTEKMDEISTSFCFICLLHLANEKGLKIEVGSEYDANEGREVDGDSKKVGDIWGLKVYRDPNATPAA